MSVELIRDKDPFRVRVSGDCPLDVCRKVFFGPCVAIGRFHHLASGHIEVDDETLGAMTNVLELLPLYLAGHHRQLGMFAFQGLHAAQFIGAQHLFSLLGQFRRLAIQSVDVLHLVVKVLVKDWCQPIAHLMGFEIALFLKASPRVGARFGLQCCAS